MTVSSILDLKGRKVMTASASTSIQDVVATLAENKIGALIIVDDSGEMSGIASERDIVRSIAKIGSDALLKPIATCMTHNVVSCEESDAISTVMAQMSEGRFRHVPVVSNGKLTGMISIGDVVKSRIQQIERDAEDMKRYIAG